MVVNNTFLGMGKYWQRHCQRLFSAIISTNTVKGCYFNTSFCALIMSIATTLTLASFSGHVKAQSIQPAQKQYQSLNEAPFAELNNWLDIWQTQYSEAGSASNQAFNRELSKRLDDAAENRTKYVQEFITFVKRLTLLVNSKNIIVSDENFAELTYLQAHQETLSGNIKAAYRLHKTLSEHSVPEVRNRANYNLLNLAVITFDYDLAIEIQETIRENLESMPAGQTKEITHLMLGYFYIQIGEYALSKKILDQVDASKLSERDKCIFAFHRLRSEKGLGHLESMEVYFNRGEHRCLSINEPLLFNAMILVKIDSALENNQTQLAGQLLDKHVTLMSNNSYHATQNIRVKLRYQMTTDQVEQANRSAEALSTLLAKSRSEGKKPHEGTSSYKLLATFYRSINDFERAQEFLELYQQHLQYTLAEELAKAQAREQMRQAQMLDEQRRQQLKQSLLNANEKQQTAQQALQSSINNRIAVQFSLLALAIVITVLYVFMRRYQRIMTPLKQRLQLDAISGALTRESLENLIDPCLSNWYSQQVPVAALIVQLPGDSNQEKGLESSQALTVEQLVNEDVPVKELPVQANLSKQRLWEYQQQLMMQQTVSSICQLAKKNFGIEQLGNCSNKSKVTTWIKSLYHALFSEQEYQPRKKSLFIARASHRKFIVFINDIDKVATQAFARQLRKHLNIKLAVEGINIGVTHSDNSGYRFRYLMMDLIAALQSAISKNPAIKPDDVESTSVQPYNQELAVAYCPQTILESPSYQDNPSTTLFKQTTSDNFTNSEVNDDETSSTDVNKNNKEVADA